MKIKLAIGYEGDAILLSDHGLTKATADRVREDLDLNPGSFSMTPGIYEFDLCIEGDNVDYKNSRVIYLAG